MKKKGIKKVVGMFMAFCISISSVMPILANDNLNDNKIVIDEVYDDTHVVVEVEKDQDGNDVFIQYNNGEFYEKAVLQRDNKKLIITSNQKERTVNEIIDLSNVAIEVESVNIDDITSARINDRYMGSVTFKASGAGNLKANVSYVGEELKPTVYDIYGAEKSFAA